MILIAHRGNTEGANPESENKPDYISSALRAGFDVEVDVWSVNGKFFLGHDKPKHEVSWRFLKNPCLWCHAKNTDALSSMLSLGIHCFWHQSDDYTLTSKGYVWIYPQKDLVKQGIIVCDSFDNTLIGSCTGVCSDNIKAYRDEILLGGIL